MIAGDNNTFALMFRSVSITHYFLLEYCRYRRDRMNTDAVEAIGIVVVFLVQGHRQVEIVAT